MKKIFIILLALVFISGCYPADDFEVLPGTLPQEETNQTTEEVTVPLLPEEATQELIVEDEIEDLTTLDTGELEQALLTRINIGRESNLRTTEKLNEAARSTTTGAAETLTEQNIFFLSAEEAVAVSTSKKESEILTQLSEELIGSGKTGTENYAGLGVRCEKEQCTARLLTVDLEDTISVSTGSGYCVYEELYTAYTDIDAVINLGITISSNTEAHWYIIPDREEYDKCGDGEDFRFSQQWRNTKDLQDMVKIGRGYGLLVETIQNNTEATVQLDYSKQN